MFHKLKPINNNNITMKNLKTILIFGLIAIISTVNTFAQTKANLIDFDVNGNITFCDTAKTSTMGFYISEFNKMSSV